MNNMTVLDKAVAIAKLERRIKKLDKKMAKIEREWFRARNHEQIIRRDECWSKRDQLRLFRERMATALAELKLLGFNIDNLNIQTTTLKVVDGEVVY